MNKKIFLNQIGYVNTLPKTAALTGKCESFSIINASNGKVMFSGPITEPAYDPSSDDNVSQIDFSEFSKCGNYYIKAGIKKSPVFTISERPYQNIKLGLLKGLYYNRCCALDSRFAGEHSHRSCHSELVPLFENPSIRIDVSGGWHEAGGYGKFTVGTCIALAHMLYAYWLFPDGFSEITGIPESGNGIPDILNECRIGLEWLLKMQAHDGGVYHKVVPNEKIPFIMPENDTAEYFVFAKSHQATLCSCAVFSLASRIFENFDRVFSAKLYDASINAWIWLMNNPQFTNFKNPPSIPFNTAGDSSNDSFNDELFWAVCELYETTGTEQFHEKINELYSQISATGFINTDCSGFGTIVYLFGSRPVNETIRSSLCSSLCTKAEWLCLLSRQNAYRTAKSSLDYTLGSNMHSMTDSIALILAHKISGNEKYIRTAAEQLNYILGKNPMELCYVTGFGSKSVMHPHHRPSESDDIDEPVPGLLVCGPCWHKGDKCTEWNIPSETPPAKCYYDIVYSFSTNEFTIYCNSSAIFVTGFFDSLNK